MPEPAPKPLRISTVCRSHFAGNWIKPARITEEIAHKILARLTNQQAEAIYDLLVQECNSPKKEGARHRDLYRLRQSINIRLKGAIDEKYYRLAVGSYLGRDATLHQVWEVTPA